MVSRIPVGVLTLLALAMAPTARAQNLVGPWVHVEPDGHDSHERPPGWDIYAVPEPPPYWIAPEYPLAAAFVPANSGNFTPDAIESHDYVVVHTMQGSYNGTISWFQNPAAVVSAHYVMRASDGEITQMVLDKDRAYHVGTANRYALGIEHEGWVDDPDQWYTWANYQSSARLTRWLTIQHAIPVDRQHIVAHSELPNQTHTDPGPGWNWNLYMALIHEVVPPSEIRGVVVDRSKPCTLTASVDTPIKRTAMPTHLQPAEDKCAVTAGTTLDYWHARRDIDGHHRLFMPAGEGPCAGAGLDADAYIIAADWTALCPDEAIAAAGVTVTLDGGGPIVTGPDGSFSFMAGTGAHTIDAAQDGVFLPASRPVDLAVYPGARLVIALDPAPAPDPTSDATSEPTEPSGGSEAGTAGTAATGTGGGEAGGDEAGDASGPGGEPTGGPSSTTGASLTEGGPDSGGAPALPDGYGGDDGCGCVTAGPSRSPASAALLLLGVLAIPRRRRRAG